jgi:hypothetical protein
MKAETAQLTIRKILGKLINEEGYTQMDIYQKLQLLEHPVSRASISNLWNDKPGVSLPLLKKAATGLIKLLERDLCLTYDAEQDTFLKINNCLPRPVIISELDTNELPDNDPQPKYRIHDGRLDVTDKVALYQKASYEIIEIGIGLRSFTSYFSSKRESAFYEPIIQKLEQGINFKCYLIDPEGGFLRRYMEDRAVIMPQELEVLEDIPRIIPQLKQLFLQINKVGYRGKMELYSYNHFPYYHVSVIDGDTERGALCISPYLFGLSRANAPVVEVDRKTNPILYRKYWRSVAALINSNRTVRLV